MNSVQAKSVDKQLTEAELERAYTKIYGKYQGKRQAFYKARGKQYKGHKTRVTTRQRVKQVSRHQVPARYKAVQAAKQQLRKRYRWGGSSPGRGFDCSGLMQYAFKKARIYLPRTAAAQYRSTKRVSLSRMQTGDLIFFHTRRSRSRVNHVGIYLGDGKFIHAPRTGKRVSVATLNGYWKRRVIGAGRV
jgi:cell wall-associated NlpC family hydrolase